MTCLHCSVGNGGTLEDIEKDPLTGLPIPDVCSYCKSNNKLIVGVLGDPNVLTGKQEEVLYKIEFSCPYLCGRKNMNITSIQEHSIWFCDMKPFEVKAQLIER